MVELPERGFVKICGVTNVDDARAVLSSGASALGLIFAASPRQVTREQARGVVEATNGDLLRSAVFRDDESEFILDTVRDLNVEMVQIHGNLNKELLAALRASGLLIVKALDIEGDEFSTFDETLVDAVLVDGPRPGSGTAHSWERLVERRFRVPLIAAGGLSPFNVADTILVTNSWGVDCASGVEVSPRKKDHGLVNDFVANARQAFASMEGSRAN